MKLVLCDACMLLPHGSQEWDSISSDAKNLISQLLERDAEKRLSASEVLTHPWLEQVSHCGHACIPTNCCVLALKKFWFWRRQGSKGIGWIVHCMLPWITFQICKMALKVLFTLLTSSWWYSYCNCSAAGHCTILVSFLWTLRAVLFTFMFTFKGDIACAPCN